MSSTMELPALERKPPDSGELPQASEHEGWALLSRYSWMVLTILAAVMVAQLWTSVRELSVTSDETDHLHAGYRYLECNDFGWNPEHPSLAKIVAAIPLLGMRVNDPIPNACGLPTTRIVDFRAGHDFVFANPESMLQAARMAVSVFAVLLLVVAWFFARSLFGLPAALLTGVLVCFEPNLLAHGALVTTDVAGAFGFALAIYALWRYLEQPGTERILGLGLALGLALSLKHSTVILIGILPALIVSDVLLAGRRERNLRLRRGAWAFALALIIGVVVLWGSYGFRYAARPGGAKPWINWRLDEAGRVARKVIPAIERTHLLPQAYVVGLQDIVVESELGREGYLLGQAYHGGKWCYFPVTAAIKFTVPFLSFILLSAASLRFWRAHLRQLIFLALPVAVYLSTSATSGMNIGVRHILPVIPLLAIFGAAGVWNAPWGRKPVLAAACVLLALHGATSLHAYPNYISYGNELWGGPRNVYKHLADSNTDWGQAQKMARAYLERARPDRCFFIRAYVEENADYAIPCADISELRHDIPPSPFSGTLIVSANVVDGVVPAAGGRRAAQVFRGRAPVTKLGGSALLVYAGTFELGPIIAAQHIQKIGSEVHDPRAVLAEARVAEQFDPANFRAHDVMCQVYIFLGETERARPECATVFQLLATSPEATSADRQRLVALMKSAGLAVPGWR